MPKRRKKPHHFLIPPFAVAAIIMLSISIWFFYRGRDTLNTLISHGTNIKATQIYGRWLDLAAPQTVEWGYVLQTLKELDYHEVPANPSQPGEYRASYPIITMYAHVFVYPDSTQPAQLLKLHFSNQRLAQIEPPAEPGGKSWRLEPKELAQWSVREIDARPQIKLADLPSYVPQAILAVEDKRFYRHGAIDGVGVLRALFVDLEHARLRQGASTISQQLARSVFLSPNRTWSRKTLEAILAFYLEARFTKDQLLEMYLNQVYWGQNGSDPLLGIESASRAYFDKSAKDLSLSEAALLAGLLQSPNHFSPRAAPQMALLRRRVVLALMQSQHLITPTEFQSAVHDTLHLAPPSSKTNPSAYFLTTLQDNLEQQYNIPTVSGLGWRIFTTIDPVLQKAALSALRPASAQAALVAMDPQNGAVRAWIGGTNYATSPFDRAAYARRQPGSAFKPFVFLAALDQKKATTATLLEDKPIKIKTPLGTWAPQNYDRRYRGTASVWDSLVQSLNVPTVNLAMMTGLAVVADYAHRAGILSPLREVPSLALGTSEVTLSELTNAYATLAAGGIYRPAYKVESIVDGDGKIIETHAPVSQVVFDPSSVYLVTQMLQAVFDEGTARAARSLGFTAPMAGKTGTSENYQDAWFLGYSSSLVCGVWVGYDRPLSLGHSAAGIALPLWVSFMQKALAGHPAVTFAAPANLTWKTIDPDTGLLAKTGCPRRRKASFLPGTEPQQYCTVHPGGILGFFYRLRK